jgi:hypothetical protein
MRCTHPTWLSAGRPGRRHALSNVHRNSWPRVLALGLVVENSQDRHAIATRHFDVVGPRADAVRRVRVRRTRLRRDDLPRCVRRVASDEDNTLRVYRRGRPEPVGEAPLAAFLDSGNKESDLEAAAAVGKHIYWIASHGRNSKGKLRPDRQRFFATDIDPGAQPGVTPAGTPYRGLLDDLATAPTLAGLRLGDARWQPAGGIPQPGAQRPGAAGAVAQPLRAGDGRGDWIVAGPASDASVFTLYRWSGQTKDAPRIVDSSEFVGLRPEALFELPGGGGTLQILSDDGGGAHAVLRLHPLVDEAPPDGGVVDGVAARGA